jgi:hypothetical protein
MDIFDAPKNSIRTNSGIYINVFEPKPEMINIEDIAHALASLPRFGGHLNKHYSVAQHCVRCCEMAETLEDKKAALLHDASEAYMLDIPTPIKAMLPDYKKYENNLMIFIANHFKFEYPLNENVHNIDRHMLLYEWENLVVNESDSFECWSHSKAKEKFIELFNDLYGISVKYKKVGVKPYKVLNMYPVYTNLVYKGHEPFKIVGIRQNQVELEGDYSGVGLDKSKEWFDDELVFAVSTVCDEQLKPNGCQIHNVNCCGGGFVINKHVRYWETLINED